MEITKKTFEAMHNVRLVSKDKDWLMRIIGLFWPRFMTDYWTTYRMPWMKRSVICYPLGVGNPISHRGSLRHELIHVKQQKGFWGLLKSALYVSVIPLPILFSGRWWLERQPYLNDIQDGRRSIEDAVQTLWRGYAWCWPKPLMRKWFKANLKPSTRA